MNRSLRELGRAGMLSDNGAPRCPACRQPLYFGTDRQGRTTESCVCGYAGFLETRGGLLQAPAPNRRKSSPTAP